MKLQSQLLSNSQLNTSSSKMKYSFPKTQRFDSKRYDSFSLDKFYDLPEIKNKRSAGIGYGSKIDLSKKNFVVPAPNLYQIGSQFQISSKRKEGITIAEGRDKVIVGDMFRQNFKVPSPFEYNPEKPHKSLSYSMSTRIMDNNDKWIKMVPGPNNYKPFELTNQETKVPVSKYMSAPSTKFGHDKRLSEVELKKINTPSPNQCSIWVMKIRMTHLCPRSIILGEDQNFHKRNDQGWHRNSKHQAQATSTTQYLTQQTSLRFRLIQQQKICHNLYNPQKIRKIQTPTMTTLRKFSLFDMLSFNNINLDPMTQTFSPYFYAQYLIKWPQYCVSLWNCTGNIQGYLMGKVEGDQSVESKSWHGHVTAVTVAPESRKQGLARLLMNYLEKVSEGHRGYFVDLFVRASNHVAIEMYRKLGYEIYRTVNKYYSSSLDSSGEDAHDMRKSLSRDTTGQTSKPTGKKIEPNELQFN